MRFRCRQPRPGSQPMRLASSEDHGRDASGCDARGVCSKVRRHRGAKAQRHRSLTVAARFERCGSRYGSDRGGGPPPIARVTGRSACPARLGAGADRFAKAFRALREQLNIWRVDGVGSKCWGGIVGGWRWVLRGGGFWQSRGSVAPLGLAGGAWRVPGAHAPGYWLSPRWGLWVWGASDVPGAGAAGLLAFAPVGLVAGWILARGGGFCGGRRKMG